MTLVPHTEFWFISISFLYSYMNTLLYILYLHTYLYLHKGGGISSFVICGTQWWGAQNVVRNSDPPGANEHFGMSLDHLPPNFHGGGRKKEI